MNEWKIEYVYDGNQVDVVTADTLELAITRWRKDHQNVPSLALWKVVCIK